MLVLAGVAAPAAGRMTPLPVGVTIAGLPVGGFNSEEARHLVRAGLSRPVEFELGSRRWTASTAKLGLAAAVDDAIARAFEADPGEAVEVTTAVGSEQLERYVRSLDRKFSREPKDAEVAGLDAQLRPIVTREVTGRKLDRGATAAAIARELRTAVREPVRPVLTARPARVTLREFGPVVVIRRESKALYVYEGGNVVRVMRVATGQAQYPTPLGTFSIVDMQRHPWWYPPDSDWARGLKPVPPGPGNPLGTRWMGLSAWGVGIHGTPDPASIGYSASHGCIRLAIPDAEWLFSHVRIGTPVVIVSA